MPGFKGHFAGGALLSSAVLGGLWWFGFYRADWPILAALVGVSVTGALFPDVDTDSKGQHLFYAALIVADFVLIYQALYKYAAILGLCAMFPAAGSHRGWTHTLWAMLLIPLPIMLIPHFFLQQSWREWLPFYLAFSGGYFSHLLFDWELKLF